MQNEIVINENFKIPYGNMCIVFDLSGHKTLHELCIELEQSLKYDYDAFALNFRLVLEEWAICEEVKRRIDYSGGRFNPETTRSRITQEISSGQIKVPELLADLCVKAGDISHIKETIQKYSADSYSFNDDYQYTLDFVIPLFRFASRNAHSGTKGIEALTEETCKDYFRKLFALITAYYGNPKKADGGILPFDGFYPVSKKLCRENGIILPEGKYFYVKPSEGKNSFYVFSKAGENLDDTQKRDTETIKKLWWENIDSPQNIISHATFIENESKGGQQFWVYPLPSYPQSLTDEYIRSLTDEEKLAVIHGIVKGIASMHNAIPPFYHRSLSPSSFLVCKIKDKLKPLLINFDCVKDTDEGAEFTVFYAVNDQLHSSEAAELLFAPELLSDELSDSDDFDWAKVDIFALAKTVIKILTGSYAVPDSKPECLSENQYLMLLNMCEASPENRPSINEITDLF